MVPLTIIVKIIDFYSLWPLLMKSNKILNFIPSSVVFFTDKSWNFDNRPFWEYEKSTPKDKNREIIIVVINFVTALVIIIKKSIYLDANNKLLYYI